MQQLGAIREVTVPRLVVRQKWVALVAGVLAIVAAVVIATSAFGSSGSPSVAATAETAAESLYPGAVSLEESKRFFEGTPR